MAKKEILKPFILSWEGGFANHPNDKGGATNRGITIATFRSVFGKTKTVTDLKRMSDAQWDEVFKKLFWDRCKADQIEDQAVANILVDWCWGSGIVGIKYAQQALGLKADDIVGAKTLAALNAKRGNKTIFGTNGKAEPTTFEILWNRREQHFMAIARSNKSQRVFLKGWLNRLDSIKENYLLLNTKNGKEQITWDKDGNWKQTKIPSGVSTK